MRAAKSKLLRLKRVFLFIFFNDKLLMKGKAKHFFYSESVSLVKKRLTKKCQLFYRLKKVFSQLVEKKALHYKWGSVEKP